MSGETPTIDESVLSKEREPLPPTRIILMRHAQSQANLPGGEGTANAVLTPLGHDQARRFAEEMKEANVTFDAIYTSGRDRGIATAQEITSVLGLDIPQHIDKRLKEKRDGIATGIPIREASTKLRREESTLPDQARWNYIPSSTDFDQSQFETYAQVADRMEAAITDIIANNPGSDVLIVSHAMAMSSLIARFREQKLWPDEIAGSVFKNSIPNNTGYFSFEGAPSETGVQIEMFDYDLTNMGGDPEKAQPDTA